MGVMDKAKARAEAALAKGKEGMAQGQAKLDAMQAKKQGDALLRDLGAAYYAKERAGGSADAVSAALAKVVAHEAEHGAVDTSATAPAEGTTGGSFTIDDV
jgi:hypothetical protein